MGKHTPGNAIQYSISIVVAIVEMFNTRLCLHHDWQAYIGMQ